MAAPAPLIGLSVDKYQTIKARQYDLFTAVGGDQVLNMEKFFSNVQGGALAAAAAAGRLSPMMVAAA